MYLNIFERDKVIEVLNFLKENNTNDIVFLGNEDFEDSKYLKLYYFSAMHRVDVDVLDLSKPLYTNEDCISSLCSEEKFIKIVTNGKFRM